MIYNFRDRKDLNEKVEKELLRMKEVYQKQEMSAAELAKHDRGEENGTESAQ